MNNLSEEELENNDLRFNSYITKDELIKIISELHFKYVKNAHLEVITGFLMENNPDDPNDSVITRLYYTIDLE